MIAKKYLLASVALILIILTLAWAGSTKAGYIPNTLGIEILCSDKENKNGQGSPSTYDDDSRYPDFPKYKIEKPVIYLYPETKSEITVELNYDGEIIADYPEYDTSINGWKVTAFSDGRIINRADNKEYNYLFWEGTPKTPINWNVSEGFVVEGSDTVSFLQTKLTELGLTPEEYNEFIVYWYPRMKDNKYNLIHFAGEQYAKTAPLKITPQPDSILRVFMVFQPLDKEVTVKEQEIQPFDRKGFTVVEWGGTEID